MKVHRFKYILLCLWLSLFDNVASLCPNGCSMNGICNYATSVCTCNPPWNGSPDCSRKTCPKGRAWADKASTINTAHSLMECSNAGICDQTTGQCVCAQGYTGAACQRALCPNGCSAHGVCRSIADVSLAFGPATTPSVGGNGIGPTYANWEANMGYMCVCDKGYFGPDCSQRMCPKGDDPLTLNQGYRTIAITVGATGSSLIGAIKVTFNGETATLNANVLSNSPSSCSAAFSALNNVGSAQCTISSIDTTTNGAVYTVAFTSWAISTAENNIFTNNGNPPLSAFTCDISGVTSTNSPTCSISDIVNSNVIENIFCSGRGICAFDTGSCTCFSDFVGYACNIASSILTILDQNDGFLINPTGANYSGRVLYLTTAKSRATDFNFIYAEANNVPIFKIDGMGNTQLYSGNLAISSGGLTVSSGLTVQTGGITVQDGGGSFTSTSPSSTVLTVAAMSTTYTGTVLTAQSSAPTGPGFYLFQAISGSSNSMFDIRGDGLTTIRSGGLSVQSGGASFTDSRISVPTLSISNTALGFTGSVLSLSATAASRYPLSDYYLISATVLGSIVFSVEASGRTTINNGGLVVSGTGGGSITNSAATDPALTVTASNTAFSGAAVLSLSTAASASSSYYLISASSNGVPVFSVDGTGKTVVGSLAVLSGGINVGSGGLTITAGGHTINAGGLTVTAGGATIQSGGLSVVTGGGSIKNTANSPALIVSATSPSQTATVMKIAASAAASSSFNLIEARTATTNLVFSVDGTGGITSSGNIATTSTAAGSITTSGGIGIAGDGNFGGNIQITSTVDSTSTTTGSLICAGGLSVQGGVSIGGDIISTSTTASSSTLTGAIRAAGGIGVQQDAYIGGIVAIQATTASSSTTTGALQCAGGIGVAGAGYFGGAIVVQDSTSSSSPYTGSITCAGGLGVQGNINAGGTVSSSSTTDSTNSSTGSLTTAGGLGVALNAYIGGSVVVEGTTASTSSLTGSLRINGGAGIQGNVYVGGQIVASDTTAATSSTTGALRSAGGLGIQGNAYFGSAITAQGTITCTSYSQTSDRRLKKDIEEIRDVEDKLERLKPVSFRWRNDEFPQLNLANTSQVGFIAQDLEKIFPDLVHDSPLGYKTVDYNGIIPHLVSALNAQRVTIDSLMKELAKCHNSSKSYEQRVEEMMQEMDEKMRKLLNKIIDKN